MISDQHCHTHALTHQSLSWKIIFQLLFQIQFLNCIYCCFSPFIKYLSFCTLGWTKQLHKRHNLVLWLLFCTISYFKDDTIHIIKAYIQVIKVISAATHKKHYWNLSFVRHFKAASDENLNVKPSLFSTRITPSHLTCPIPSDLELLLCTAGGCCSASLWFCGFESNRVRLREAY